MVGLIEKIVINYWTCFCYNCNFKRFDAEMGTANSLHDSA